jgi:7,8-dihydropterin-6-yl-methyl-4-(beta-D-ribofuranosyl)aminobenzene 5'-phosphate synthase
LRLTVVYDNNQYDSSMTAAWGFSCFLEGTKRTILFDTGGDGSILLENMRKLELSPGAVEVVVLSHAHYDHTGGLQSFLKVNSEVSVLVGASFPESIGRMVLRHGAELENVRNPEGICSGVYTTGEMGRGIAEQSLVVSAKNGAVLVTGCAHPGVLEIVRRAEEITDGKICLVIGGFHLGGSSELEIDRIVKGFIDHDVNKAAPCHCSGKVCRDMFRESFGPRYIPAGAGTRVEV